MKMMLELPEDVMSLDRVYPGHALADQVRAYAAQCVRVALEEAVDHCRKVMDDLDDGGQHTAVERVHNRIRSMINEGK